MTSSNSHHRLTSPELSNDTPLPEDSPTKQPSDLGRMLSMKPSSAEITLSKIGSGTCGTIFTRAGSGMVFKMAKHDTDALTGDLFNDFKMHLAVLHAMQSIEDGADFPQVPLVYAYIPRSETAWWQENTALSAATSEHDFDTPCNTLCSERIVPLPLSIRSHLIEEFCPERLRNRAHQDVTNKDCLVRVYLGARKTPDGPRKMFFSLRNYKLHLNQMLDSGMDVKALARAMAGALAIMHWKACIDAKDVEFALGSSARSSISPVSTAHPNFDHVTPDRYLGPRTRNSLNWHQHTIDLWLLDFNLCSTIEMDDSGVAMAVEAWKINDPYYPKPLQDSAMDRDLWSVFVSRYIEVSDQILRLKPTLAALPRKFIAGIIQVQRERQESA